MDSPSPHTIKTILPPALNPGDTIGVMAPSSYVNREDIEAASAWIEERGYNVFVHPQTFERNNQSAGSPLQKALALQGLWQRDDIKAIWCAGGGNRSMHFIDSINFKNMPRKPKFLIGFSDVTVLLNAIYAHTGIIGIHAPTFKNIHEHKDSELTLKAISGELKELKMEPVNVLKAGSTEGPLVGGNLSLFQYLPQTMPNKFWKNSILFLEDCSEEISRLDRMLLHLKRLGVLNEINGLMLGEFTNMGDNGTPYGFTWEDIIAEHTQDLDIPIVMNAPFGHAGNLPAFPVGGTVNLLAEQNAAVLKFEPYAS